MCCLFHLLTICVPIRHIFRRVQSRIKLFGGEEPSPPPLLDFPPRRSLPKLHFPLHSLGATASPFLAASVALCSFVVFVVVQLVEIATSVCSVSDRYDACPCLFSFFNLQVPGSFWWHVSMRHPRFSGKPRQCPIFQFPSSANGCSNLASCIKPKTMKL